MNVKDLLQTPPLDKSVRPIEVNVSLQAELLALRPGRNLLIEVVPGRWFAMMALEDIEHILEKAGMGQR